MNYSRQQNVYGKYLRQKQEKADVLSALILLISRDFLWNESGGNRFVFDDSELNRIKLRICAV